MSDQNARRRGAEAGVDRGQQLTLDEVEEAVTALVQAAAAHRETRRREIAQAIRVLYGDDDHLRHLPVARELVGDAGHRLERRFAIQHDEHGIPAARRALRERRRQRDPHAARFTENDGCHAERLPAAVRLARRHSVGDERWCSVAWCLLRVRGGGDGEECDAETERNRQSSAHASGSVRGRRRPRSARWPHGTIASSE